MDSRGSMAVEFLVLVPLLVLLWQALVSLHGLDATAAGALAETRTCAWHAALSGCATAPPGCQLAAAGVAPDGEVDRAGVELALRLPLLRGALEADPPRTIRALRDTSASSPLWGEVPVRARHLVPCNALPSRLDPREVARATCREVSDSCP